MTTNICTKFEGNPSSSYFSLDQSSGPTDSAMPTNHNYSYFQMISGAVNLDTLLPPISRKNSCISILIKIKTFLIS